MRQIAVLLGLASLLGELGCVAAECANPDFRQPECRVIAENELARLRLPDGVELRFLDPHDPLEEAWVAAGHFVTAPGEPVVARFAGLGDALLEVELPAGQALPLELENLHPRAEVRLETEDGARIIVPPAPFGLRRSVVVPGSGRIHVEPPCGPRHRIAVTADIQTNPDAFRRILERLQIEAEEAPPDAPLVGLLLLGDLSESSRWDEFVALREILEQSPVPIAVTAGNHDTYARERPHYNDAFGPGNHAFNVCDTRVALVDSGSGWVATSVLARLSALLDRQGARHLVLGMHHPPHPGLTGAGWSDEASAHQLLAEAALAEVDLLMAGHKHALIDFPEIPIGDAVLREIIVGTGGAIQGIGPPEYGYLRLELGEAGMDACFVEVPPVGQPRAGDLAIPRC